MRRPLHSPSGNGGANCRCGVVCNMLSLVASSFTSRYEMLFLVIVLCQRWTVVLRRIGTFNWKPDPIRAFLEESINDDDAILSGQRTFASTMDKLTTHSCVSSMNR